MNPITNLTAQDQAWLKQAIDLATENVQAGGGPFGAVLVSADGLIATGQNQVTRLNDPTAHAEVVAIRNAGQARGTFNLSGLTLYSSCEPCPMCMASALWARVDRVVYAADRHDAAAGGFDDLEFYEMFARDRSTWGTPVEEAALEEKKEPFHAWLNNAARIDY
ncbi:nucleoside deaminase [Arthrobacter sp. S2(2024)]|uniref:nucleoside deaminase n=1 Tax=Arthrobacter sp. S2(2024) TaxID=3111911 RepID=UPI002FC745C5